MKRYRSRVTAILAGSALVMMIGAGPALAFVDEIPLRTYYVHPGPFCAQGRGVFSNSGPNVAQISSTTLSKKFVGCTTSSPAAAGVIAAEAKLWKNSYGLCRTGAHVTNGSGASSATSNTSVVSCGPGVHYSTAGWRVTYDGVARRSDDAFDGHYLS